MKYVFAYDSAKLKVQYAEEYVNELEDDVKDKILFVKCHKNKKLRQITPQETSTAKKYQEYWDHYSVNKLSKEYSRLVQAQFQPNEEFLGKYRDYLKQNMKECANYHLVWYILYEQFRNDRYWPIFRKLFQYIEPISNKISNFLSPNNNDNNNDFDSWLDQQFEKLQIPIQAINRQQSNLFSTFTPHMGPSFTSNQNLYSNDGSSSRNNARIKNKYQYDNEFDENNENKDDDDDDEDKDDDDDDNNDDNDEFDERDDDNYNSKEKSKKKNKKKRKSNKNNFELESELSFNNSVHSAQQQPQHQRGKQKQQELHYIHMENLQKQLHNEEQEQTSSVMSDIDKEKKALRKMFDDLHGIIRNFDKVGQGVYEQLFERILNSIDEQMELIKKKEKEEKKRRKYARQYHKKIDEIKEEELKDFDDNDSDDENNNKNKKKINNSNKDKNGKKSSKIFAHNKGITRTSLFLSKSQLSAIHNNNQNDNNNGTNPNQIKKILKQNFDLDLHDIDPYTHAIWDYKGHHSNQKVKLIFDKVEQEEEKRRRQYRRQQSRYGNDIEPEYDSEGNIVGKLDF